MLPALPTGMHSASSSSELLDQLEGRRLLALDAELVDRVDERDRVALDQLADERQRLVEVAAQRDHPRAVHQRLRELAGRDLALGDDHRAADPRARRVGGRDAAVLPVEAQITASAPSRTAADTAQVMPRSLNEPVGLAPSSFSHTSAPTFSLRRRACTSGVEPSLSETTGSPSANGSRSRIALDEAGLLPCTSNVSSITRIARGGERMKSMRPMSSTAAKSLRLEDRVHDHHQARVLAQPLLHDRLDRGALQPQHLRDLRQHARAVRHLHVQVERGLDVLDDLQAIGASGVEAGGIIALITSPSTALAVCGPPAPGPDMVISVIALDSTVTALNGPWTEASGWPPYRNAGCTRTDSPPSTRSAVPISFSPSPSSRAYSMSSAVMCSMPS